MNEVECGRIVLGNGQDFLIWKRGMGRTAEIHDIHVGSDRRKGRGRELLQRLLEVLRRPDRTGKATAMLYAITRVSNTIAHQFYEACGFLLIGRLNRFYREAGDRAEHALVYGLEL